MVMSEHSHSHSGAGAHPHPHAHAHAHPPAAQDSSPRVSRSDASSEGSGGELAAIDARARGDSLAGDLIDTTPCTVFFGGLPSDAKQVRAVCVCVCVCVCVRTRRRPAARR
jgi:hypothetical protein